jgi:hypothetical protein
LKYLTHHNRFFELLEEESKKKTNSEEEKCQTSTALDRNVWECLEHLLHAAPVGSKVVRLIGNRLMVVGRSISSKKCND